MPSLAVQALIAACLSLAAVAYASEPAVPAPTSAAPAWLKVHGNGLHSSGQPTAEQLQALPAHGIGVVKGLDAKQSMITLDHEAIKELNWPPMNMDFKVANAKLLKGLKVGVVTTFV